MPCCCRMQASRFWERGSSSEEEEDEEETEEESESESDSDSDASGDDKRGASKCVLLRFHGLIMQRIGLFSSSIPSPPLPARVHASTAPHTSCCRLRVRRFLVGSDSSDSDDDKRVVRSAKDRRFEELNATCAELRVSPSTL